MIFIYIYINDVICRELNGIYYKRNFIFLIDLFIKIKYKLFKYKIIFKIQLIVLKQKMVVGKILNKEIYIKYFFIFNWK